MRYLHYYTLILLLFSGCAQQSLEPKINFKPPQYVQELPSREEENTFNSRGSLFGQGENPLFTDRKAMHINDIVTVVVSESTSSQSSNQKNLSRTNNTNLGGGLVSNAGAGTGVEGLVRNINDATSFGFKSDTTTAFAGAGTAQLSENFTTTISARVIKILQNGNYFIDGSREIMIDGQKQSIHVSGVISPLDIDIKNQINSRFIADAKIMYKTEGDIARQGKQGWGTRAIEAVWPF